MAETTKGLKELRVALDRVTDAVHDELSEAVDDEARAIRADERTAIPVLTGEARAGIRVRRDSPLHATVGIFDRELFWVVWLEWGRKNAAPRPFATPAAEAARRRWPKRAAEAIKRGAGGK